MLFYQIAQFNVYDTLAKSLLPTFTAFYVGAWSDFIGRKVIIYIYLATCVVSQAFVVVNAYFIMWPKELLLVSTLMQSIAGKSGITKFKKSNLY